MTRSEFETLENEIAELKKQILALKAAQFGKEEEFSEGTVQILAAVIAAYLGKRATIRFIRKVGEEGEVWRHQGRTSLQGSHQMPRTRATSSH